MPSNVATDCMSGLVTLQWPSFSLHLASDEHSSSHVSYYPSHKHESLIDYDILERWLD